MTKISIGFVILTIFAYNSHFKSDAQPLDQDLGVAHGVFTMVTSVVTNKQNCQDNKDNNTNVTKQVRECNLSPQQSRAGIIGRQYRWPKARVPYEVDSNFPPDQQDNIQEAMKQISNATCVTFKKRTTEEDYVYFNYGGDGCNSQIGRQGDKQTINLSQNGPGYYDCGQRLHTVIHEILRSLGFFHEMSRPDRDEYVTIVTDNIEEGQEHNFVIWNDQINYGLPFDYHSVLMYKWNAFAKDPTKPTIIAKKPGVGKDFRGYKLSENDIAAVNAMYKCKPKSG